MSTPRSTGILCSPLRYAFSTATAAMCVCGILMISGMKRVPESIREQQLFRRAGSLVAQRLHRVQERGAAGREDAGEDGDGHGPQRH